MTSNNDKTIITKIFTPVTREVTAVTKRFESGCTTYIKQNSDPGLGFYGDVNLEYQSYQALSEYLKTPRARVRELKGFGKSLIVQSAGSEDLEKLYRLDCFEEVIQTLSLLYFDIFNMWNKTAISIDEERLSRNSRVESLDTAKKILNLDNSELAKDIFIDGVQYSSIKKVLEEVVNILGYHNAENIMVLAHGDEHFGNIFKTQDGYRIIDPRYSGYYYPSQTLNTTIGSTLIFMRDYKYTHFQDLNNSIHINFQESDFFSKLFDYFFSIYEKSLEFTGKQNILPEILFINLIRSFFGFVNPKNRDKVERNKYSILALAYIFFEKFKTMRLKI